ncbi:MAG: DUF1818 family protein [Candidatus Margulisbacteria bacterium]|nr:DUF1818 family protein [Candidatus Margulisiibacteriota bacterium]
MRKALIGLIITIIFSLLTPVAQASVSRLYVGELDSQFMAGVDTRAEFDGFFIGGDIRTLIRKSVVNEEDRTVGFLPDRTDYKVLMGFDFGDGWSIELSHVCYHRVISSQDLSMYQDAKFNQIENTDLVTIKWTF